MLRICLMSSNTYVWMKINIVNIHKSEKTWDDHNFHEHLVRTFNEIEETLDPDICNKMNSEYLKMHINKSNFYYYMKHLLI